MNQVSSKLRRQTHGYAHWCDACQEIHKLPDTWKFINNDLDLPTFTPSFLHSGYKKVIVNLKWSSPWWLYDDKGEPIPSVCHYILTDGILNYCGDCTHELSGKSVPLPDLPDGYTDEGDE